MATSINTFHTDPKLSANTVATAKTNGAVLHNDNNEENPKIRQAYQALLTTSAKVKEAREQRPINLALLKKCISDEGTALMMMNSGMSKSTFVSEETNELYKVAEKDHAANKTMYQGLESIAAKSQKDTPDYGGRDWSKFIHWNSNMVKGLLEAIQQLLNSDRDMSSWYALFDPTNMTPDKDGKLVFDFQLLKSELGERMEKMGDGVMFKSPDYDAAKKYADDLGLSQSSIHKNDDGSGYSVINPNLDEMRTLMTHLSSYTQEGEGLSSEQVATLRAVIQGTMDAISGTSNKAGQMVDLALRQKDTDYLTLSNLITKDGDDAAAIARGFS